MGWNNGAVWSWSGQHPSQVSSHQCKDLSSSCSQCQEAHFLHFLKGQEHVHEKQGIDLNAQRRWGIIFKNCNLSSMGKCLNYEMNWQLIRKIEQEITLWRNVSLRKVWWEILPKDKGWVEPMHQLEGFTHFISQPSSSSQSKQKAQFPSSAHHILRAQRVVYIGTRQSFQKWALRNKGTLFCDVTLSNGFSSEISEVLYSKGASKESCQLLAHSEEGLATHHITLSIHKETKRRQ